MATVDELRRKKILESLSNNTEKGIMLEEFYKQDLYNKLVGEPQVKSQLVNRIVYPSGRELGGYEKKPVYEELNKIPLNQQLKMMGEQFKTLPKEKNEDEAKRLEMLMRLNMLKGQRLG